MARYSSENNHYIAELAVLAKRLTVADPRTQLDAIAETCDRVAVMYAGRVAEIGPVADVIHRPAHPYTVGLMGSIPAMDEDRERLLQIDGAMPRLTAIPAGCAFNPRCPRVGDRCRPERPELTSVGATSVSCWKPVLPEGLQ